MGKCVQCGNEYDQSFTVTMGDGTFVFDSFECAIAALAPSARIATAASSATACSTATRSSAASIAPSMKASRACATAIDRQHVPCHRPA